MEGPRNHPRIWGSIQSKCKFQFEKDYCGSFCLEECKSLYVFNFTVKEKPDFRIRTIWV